MVAMAVSLDNFDTGLESDENIVSHARDRLYASNSGYDWILQRMRDDLEFSSGRQWDPATEGARDGRPCLVIDKTRKYVDKIVGSYRNKPPGIKVSPRYNSTKANAKVMEAWLRTLLSQAGSKAAIQTAGEHAAITGYGWTVATYDYESPTSFDLVPKAERVDDPRSIRIDRASTDAAGEDMRWAMQLLRMEREEAERLYGPDVCSWESIPQQFTDQWIDDNQVILSRYWWLDDVDDTLVQWVDAAGNRGKDWTDMVPAGATPVKTRPGKRPCVYYAFLSGSGVIEKKEWPGSMIPVVPTYGRQAWQDNRSYYSGVIRPAMDAQRLINYYSSTAAEVTALSPRNPYIVVEGQLEGYEDDWSLLNTKNFTYLTVKGKDLDGNPAPIPQRQQQTADTMPLLEAIKNATSDLTDVVGIYEASLGQENNMQSGKAIREASLNSDQVLAMFGDNLKRSTVRLCQIWADMTPRIVTEERLIKLSGDDGTDTHVAVNSQVPQNLKPFGIDEVAPVSFEGDYEVSIDDAQSYSTRRQESAAVGMELMATLPDAQKAAIAPEVVMQQDWPNAERIANQLRLTLPPELQGNEEVKEDPKAKAIMDQMSQEIQQQNMEHDQKDATIKQLTGALQQLQMAVLSTQDDNLTKKQIASEKNRVDLQKALIQAGNSQAIADANNETKRDIADDDRAHDAAKKQLDVALAGADKVLAHNSAQMSSKHLGGNFVGHGLVDRNHGVPDHVSLPRV